MAPLLGYAAVPEQVDLCRRRARESASMPGLRPLFLVTVSPLLGCAHETSGRSLGILTATRTSSSGTAGGVQLGRAAPGLRWLGRDSTPVGSLTGNRAAHTAHDHLGPQAGPGPALASLSP